MVLKLSKSPAFQIYPEAFMSDFDVQNMNMEEVGVYTYLLFADWLEGGLPDDLTVVEGWLKHRCTTVDSLKKPWAKFTVIKDGRRFNKRLDQEREKQQLWREKSSEGGKKSADARRERKGGASVVQPKGKGGAHSDSVSVSVSDSDKESKKEKTPQEIVTLFHEICPDLPKVQKITQLRIVHIKARNREYPGFDWRGYFETVAQSKFLMGNGDWRATFDWLINPSNFVKVFEGNYANGRKEETLEEQGRRLSGLR